MAKLYYDWDSWVSASNFDENDIETAYKKVKFRRNLYGILTVFTPLGLFLAPFWLKTDYFTKVIRYRSMDVKPNAFVSLIWFLYAIGTLFIYPLIVGSIINKTNWGMGLKLN